MLLAGLVAVLLVGLVVVLLVGLVVGEDDDEDEELVDELLRALELELRQSLAASWLTVAAP